MEIMYLTNMSPQDNTSERLSVSLDYESAKYLDKLEEKLETSRSEIIRQSLRCLNTMVEEGDISLSTVRTYLDYLSGGEHVILDISLLYSFLQEIGEGNEEFWEEIREIGKEHWSQFRDKGFEELEDILSYFEKTNLFYLSKISENTFTLKLSLREAEKWEKEFFKGFFDASPYEAEVRSKYGKIRINIVTDD